MTLAAASPRPLTADELTQLWRQLHEPTALLEVAILIGCLGAAWFLLRMWRGQQGDARSIWFGKHVIDGVLFPALALVLVLGVRRLLASEMPLVVFRIAVPVLVSLAVIRLTAKVLRAAFPTSITVKAVERTVSWLAWIGSVLWVIGVLPLLMAELDGVTWKIGNATLSLRNLIEGTLSAVLVLILSLSLSAAVEARLLRGATDNLSLRKITANVLRALMLGIGLMMALSAAGVDLTALSVLGGAVGVGLGFGLQKLAANYVSGFVILAERSLRIGDVVKVDNFEGRITDINTRYTVIRSNNGREALVPNEMLITQRVENASNADNKLQVLTTVQVPHDTDLDSLRPLLQEAVLGVSRVLQDPAPAVYLSAFAPTGLELTIGFWLGDPENGQLDPRSDVNLTVWRTLKRLGVDIPLPTQVVRWPGAGPVSAAGAAAGPAVGPNTVPGTALEVSSSAP